MTPRGGVIDLASDSETTALGGARGTPGLWASMQRDLGAPYPHIAGCVGFVFKLAPMGAHVGVE